MLKNGASAVDAVEIAIMVLEDSEITNSGYGSNLTIDGGVECDALLIDHKGRSGAVGAVARKSLHVLLPLHFILFDEFLYLVTADDDISRCQKPDFPRARRLGILRKAAVSTKGTPEFHSGPRCNRLCI